MDQRHRIHVMGQRPRFRDGVLADEIGLVGFFYFVSESKQGNVVTVVIDLDLFMTF